MAKKFKSAAHKQRAAQLDAEWQKLLASHSKTPFGTNGSKAKVTTKPDADAHLIAAAPQLLEALEDLCADELLTQDKWDNARAALRAAKGEA